MCSSIDSNDSFQRSMLERSVTARSFPVSTNPMLIRKGAL